MNTRMSEYRISFYIQGKTDVYAYIPKDTWYNYKNGSTVSSHGAWTTLPAPLDTINVHQRGGTVIPSQRDSSITDKARKLPFSLQVALDSNNEAFGYLFWDDGETVGEKIHFFHYTLRL